jgi:glycoprotein endo-alpha-1,2-mannosidase
VSDFYPSLVNAARKKGVLFIPCVSPGFNVNRTFHEKSPLFRARSYGKTYDDWWKRVIASNPDAVAIISFNEWHEGTQIEPSIPITEGRYRYLSYEGAYGKTGTTSHESYLRRARRWIDLFMQLPAVDPERYR